MSPTHFSTGYPVSPESTCTSPAFLSFRLLVCSEDKEASEQSVSADVMPQDRTLKTGLFPQEAHLCEVCGPMLRDSLHSVEHQETLHRQKPHMRRACGNRFHLTAGLLSAAQAACWRETLQKQQQQSLVSEELQIPSVRELFYLSGGREGPPGQLRTSSAAGPSHQGRSQTAEQSVRWPSTL